ncbi:4-(cytidine 5'-diphospho)-2-C-methyl-D-erythritol kinase [Parasphingorhabdus sp.]|uniref:4-(cytidine 5'-diphospho)-2-C-methyl-D-erythritol kinase n=1 Tax=Parasphingorhabdus sp. TaxID=2709688 RepID=UPI003296D7B1
MTIEGFAPAKINLSLHVTGQREDGYHLLDSLVVFAAVGDRLWFDVAPVMSMEITGPFASGVPADARNLVWRAAETAGVTGHIRLEKNLPHGAGLGGGSADAAALLRSLSKGQVGDPINMQAGLSLGADVPVCVSTAPQRMRGIGEVLDDVQPFPQCAIVMVNPAVPVPTGPVFQQLGRKDNPAMASCDGFADAKDLVLWLGQQRNDLQPPACAVAPTIHVALEALEDALLARMSGSGSTCFGIYPDEAAADAAAQRIQRAQPDWWVVSTVTFAADAQPSS